MLHQSLGGPTAEGQMVPAVGYVLEPRPTNDLEDEDDEYEDDSRRTPNAKRYPSLSTCCSIRSVTWRIWLGVRNER